MPSLSDLTSSGPVVLLDPGILRDVAAALNGLWTPVAEQDDVRRDELVAAARIRLYADRDRRGWLLVTTSPERQALLARDRHDWSVGFIAAVEDFDDAPEPAEVAALARLFRSEGIEAESALSLACAYLMDAVQVVITRDPRQFRHSRDVDLPERLELLDPFEAVTRLEIRPDELPTMPPPGAEAAQGADAWWVPRA
jgi:hypothetical protein